MNLTVRAINAAKPRQKPYKLFDERGMYLLIVPSGSKLWRLKYYFNQKEKKLALGSYPTTGLKDARDRRDEARRLLEAGEDPGEKRRREKLAKAIEAANTFAATADEYLAKEEREGQAPATLRKSHWLAQQLNVRIGSRPIHAITAQELLLALRPTENRGRLETARRMRSFAGRVFRYGIATGRTLTDPSEALVGALSTPKVKHRAAVLDPVEVGKLLRAIDAYSGYPSTNFALRLAPHVYLRPGELRQLEWSEVNFDNAVLTITATKMKMRREHRVPLSRQALAILRDTRKFSGPHTVGKYVFPSAHSFKAPLSNNTLIKALRTMNYDKDQMSPHGFRAIASTLLNESGKWNPDAIERSLAHSDDNEVRAAYSRGQYWDERVRMAQWWSDYLDMLKNGAKIIPMKFGKNGA